MDTNNYTPVENNTNSPYTQSVGVQPQTQPVVPPPPVYQQGQVPPQPGQVPPQPVYQQGQIPPQPGQVPPQPMYQQGQIPPQFVPPYDPEKEKKDKKLELLLCFLSLGLYVGGPLLIGIPEALLASLSSSAFESSAGSFLSQLSSFVGSASYIAAWVLMIIARVKFKKSVFAKVLMWVYIAVIILATVAAIIFIISCIETIKSCS